MDERILAIPYGFSVIDVNAEFFGGNFSSSHDAHRKKKESEIRSQEADERKKRKLETFRVREKEGGKKGRDSTALIP